MAGNAATALAARSRGLNSLYGAGKPKVPMNTGSDYGAPRGGGGAGPFSGGDLATARRIVLRDFVNPEIALINQAIEARSKSGVNAIGGLTSALQSKYGPMATQIGGIYGDAEGRQAAVDSALQGALNGAGGDAASALSSRLASANLPNTAALAADTASRGTGMGTTALAKGSATLSSLIGQGAAAGEYAAKLPGIAGSEGLQYGRDLQAQLNDQLASEVGQVRAKVPGLVDSTLGQITKSKTDAAALAQRQQYLDATLGQRATDTQVRAQTAQEAAAAKASQQSFSNRLAFAKTYGYDPISGQVLPGYTKDASGNVIKASKSTATKQPTLTVKMLRDGVGTAATIAENAYKGFQTTDKSGTVTNHPAIGYQQALDEMRKEGLLADPRLAKLAINELNRWYKPGERGRPLPPPKPDTGFRSADLTPPKK